MTEMQEKLPEWMLKLESKRKKQHRLAHEIGAGAPCFVCGDSCPGLDLHFWRKLCRNCKCKKEDHDVKDDEGYEQFDILLGSGSRKSKKGGFLKINVPEDAKIPVVPVETSTKGVSFDWLPPNVSEEVAAEYMQQLPAGKLPISGSDGALYRRQQLEKQVPLHDLDARHCDNLTPEEIDQLVKYLENLKNNVVGQGCVGKVPALYSESRLPMSGPIHLHAGSQLLGRPLATSQSADSIRSLPPMPPAYNSMPRPFHASSSSSAYGSGEDEDLPPPLPTSLPPRTDLKTPSEFMTDWRLADDRITALGKVTEGVHNLQLNQENIPTPFVKDNFGREIAQSDAYPRQKPQFSGNLRSAGIPGSTSYQSGKSPDQMALSQSLETPHSASVLGTGKLQEGQIAVSKGCAPASGSGVLHSHLHGRPTDAVQCAQGMHDPKEEALSGSRLPSGVAVNSIGMDSEKSAALPANSAQVSSLCPKSTVSSSAVHPTVKQELSKPLGGQMGPHSSSANTISGSTDTARKFLGSGNQIMTTPSAIALSEAVGGVQGMAEPLSGRKKVNMPGSGPAFQQSYPSGDNQLNSGKVVSKETPASSIQLKYGAHGINKGDLVAPLSVEGIVTSSVLPHTVVQSSSVGTDALPKSAQMMQQHGAPSDPACVAPCAGSTGPLPAETPGGSAPHLDCRECGLKLLAGDVAVFAERAGNAAWHPSCFVCSTCKELLVDLMYFYHKNNVYCGRHFAELLGIPRCFACDELIFVKEYTVAEGKAFHVKHFCCYECDVPLAGKQYIPVEDQPVCLECYECKYGKQCHTCQNKIAAGEQRVGWKHLNWHVQGNCFCCFECTKSLLGGRFVVKENQPFCSKECAQAGLQKMAGAA